MELNNIIDVVEKRAKDIADQEIVNYNKAHPELNLTDEAREAVRTRSISQLTLQLSKFHFKDDTDLQEQFDDWFSSNEEEDLIKACKHCLDDEAKKIREAAKWRSEPFSTPGSVHTSSMTLRIELCCSLELAKLLSSHASSRRLR